MGYLYELFYILVDPYIYIPVAVQEGGNAVVYHSN